MAKMEEWGTATPGTSAAGNRAAGLRARRGVSEESLEPVMAEGEKDKRDKLGGFLNGPNADSHRKALRRVYKILTETPADKTGMVEGTPFTKTGVKAFVEQLRANAAKKDRAGARAAQVILKLFTSDKDGAEGDEASAEKVHGVHVERLQQLGRMSTGYLQRRSGRK